MARQEQDKEDLLRDATALAERIEIAFVGADEVLPRGHLTAGFRPNGAASLFFGADPVYHFNAAGKLRRAYVDGLLFKAEAGRLVSLDRVRSNDAVQLQRHELTDAEQKAFRARVLAEVDRLNQCFNAEQFSVIGQAPENLDVLARLRVWLSRTNEIVIAESPNVGSRR